MPPGLFLFPGNGGKKKRHAGCTAWQLFEFWFLGVPAGRASVVLTNSFLVGRTIHSTVSSQVGQNGINEFGDVNHTIFAVAEDILVLNVRRRPCLDYWFSRYTKPLTGRQCAPRLMVYRPGNGNGPDGVRVMMRPVDRQRP